MPKVRTIYTCASCGYETPKWIGKCPECGDWNTFTEGLSENAPTISTISGNRSGVTPATWTLDKIDYDGEYRYKTGLSELDRVLGGGIVKGSLVLLGGDPGIGKSTILLQICQFLCKDVGVLYVSGEESARQLKLRADRLSVDTNALTVMTGTDIENICEFIHQNKPDIVIIDSIQTMHLNGVNSSSGSPAQVRECTAFLQRTAKAHDIPILVVGHVTKDGSIAGPKIMEHIVDAVLYFEGDRSLSYRILRAVKNRFGSTNEIGVFEMGQGGLSEVANPSKMLLSERPKGASGTLVVCIMEGTRPILAEVQALVTPTGFGNPRRMATGFDYNRFNLLLAVLEKRAGYFFGTADAYLNVVGGLKLDETAADLAVALALVSSLKDIAISDDVIALGEVGLAGEIRSASRIESRIMEAARMGFKKIIIPYSNLKGINTNIKSSIEIVGVKTLRAAAEAAFNH